MGKGGSVGNRYPRNRRGLHIRRHSPKSQRVSSERFGGLTERGLARRNSLFAGTYDVLPNVRTLSKGRQK